MVVAVFGLLHLLFISMGRTSWLCNWHAPLCSRAFMVSWILGLDIHVCIALVGIFAGVMYCWMELRGWDGSNLTAVGIIFLILYSKPSFLISEDCRILGHVYQIQNVFVTPNFWSVDKQSSSWWRYQAPHLFTEPFSTQQKFCILVKSLRSYQGRSVRSCVSPYLHRSVWVDKRFFWISEPIYTT